MLPSHSAIVMSGDTSWIAVAASRASASESSICLASEFALARSRHSSRSLVVLRMASSIGAKARTPLHASSMARI